MTAPDATAPDSTTQDTNAPQQTAAQFAQRVPEEVLEAVRETEGQLSDDEVALLYLLAKQIPAESDIVEIGSHRGRSTVALGLGARYGAREQQRASTPVFAIEPHEAFNAERGVPFGPADRAAFYGAMLRTGCFEEVRLINLPSAQVAPTWRRPVGLLWIDGDHRYDAVADDVLAWSQHLQLGSAIVFGGADDPQSGPYRAVTEVLESGHFQPMAGLGPRGELGQLCVLQWTPQAES
jgi:hypothetical protein